MKIKRKAAVCQGAKTMAHEVGGPSPLSLPPERAAKVLGVGRSYLYNLGRRGPLWYKEGRRRLYPVQGLHEYIVRKIAEAANATAG